MQRLRTRLRQLLAAAVAATAATSCASSTLTAPDPSPSTIALTGLPGDEPQQASSAVVVDAPAVRGIVAVVGQERPVRQLSMAFTGDMLVHSPLWRQARNTALAAGGGAAFDFRPMLEPITPLVRAADLAVCHLETPIAPLGEELSTFPLYGVPAEVVDAVAVAGYDRCSTASNHTVDRGTAGIDRTVEVLTAAGLGQAGMARTPDEIEPRVFAVAGVRVGHLSYTYGYNGLRLPEGEEWRSALIDPARIIADAQRARSAGAEVVVVSLHWGTEGRTDPTPFQREVASALTASGAIDLIVGHHAHVLQPIEQVNGVWVAYGLGNILSNLTPGGEGRWPEGVRDGAVLQVSLTVDPTGAVSVDRPVVQPTWVDITAGWLVRPVLATLADPTIGAGLRGQLEASLARTRAVLGDYLPG